MVSADPGILPRLTEKPLPSVQNGSRGAEAVRCWKESSEDATYTFHPPIRSIMVAIHTKIEQGRPIWALPLL